MIEGLHTKSREEYQREHTIKRLEERWDIVISHVGYEELCQCIRSGNAFLVRKLSSEASVFLIAIENKIVPVVYSFLSKQISTAWPKQSLRRLSKEYRDSIYLTRKFKHHLPKQS